MTSPSSTAASAARSLRSDPVGPTAMTLAHAAVRSNATVCDGFEADPPPDLSALRVPLTARQQNAIHLLAMGKSAVATARSLGIHISTLHRWKAKNPVFIAELNRRHADLFDQTITRLRSTMDRAVGELAAIFSSGSKRERQEAMWKLLPLLQPRRWMVPTGPTDPRDVLDAQIRAGRALRGEDERVDITDDERAAALAEGELELTQAATPADETPRVVAPVPPPSARTDHPLPATPAKEQGGGQETPSDADAPESEDTREGASEPGELTSRPPTPSGGTDIPVCPSGARFGEKRRAGMHVPPNTIAASLPTTSRRAEHESPRIQRIDTNAPHESPS